jgi:KUP system potassium uptake protein
LATAATVIASQAVISGCFSLTRQAVQLGYCPRVGIEHTSPDEIGQIYIRAVNWALMFATIGLVAGFQTSSALAAAYGVAVTTTETITTLLFYVVARRLWKWSVWSATLLSLTFLVIDLSFLGANIVKIPHGGWFPLVIAAGIFTLMTTWKRGRQILAERLQVGELPVKVLLDDVTARPPLRVPGTAVFMTGRAYGVPSALLHNLKHNKVIHEQVVLLTVLTIEVPRVPPEERVDVDHLGCGFHRVVLRYGFMEDPDLPTALALVKDPALNFNRMTTTFFLGRETLLATRKKGMALWRENLFIFMTRNAARATAFYRIPPNQVIEIGAQVEL